LRLTVYARVYRNAARFQALKTQRSTFSADRKISIENVPQCVAGIPLWLRQKKSSAEESVYLLDALEEAVFQPYLTIFFPL